MSQHDFDIANQTASNARADINNALKALASLSSGGTAPTTTYANMLWYDTTANIIKIRNEADSAWINLFYLDQSGSQTQVFDDTKVVNTSGTQTGLIGDQAASAWTTGTGTTESLVSPAKVKAAIDANSPQDTWVNFNGTGTIAIRNDNNVSSLTDLGTGQYSVSFTSALPTADFATTSDKASNYQGAPSPYSTAVSTPVTTSSARIEVGNELSGVQQLVDAPYVSLVAKA